MVAGSAPALLPVAGPVLLVEPPRIGEVALEGRDVRGRRFRPVLPVAEISDLEDTDSR